MREVATDNPQRLGCLLTPKNGNRIEGVIETGLPWAIDNGAFAGFDPEAFTQLISKAIGRQRLLFVVCPDVVGDAAATCFKFEEWSYLLRRGNLPIAFVGQDGQESLPVPWEEVSAFFIGGSTEWKLSDHAARLASEAKRRGKWVHMGRVNSRRRMRHAAAIGCDSVDGTSASMFGDRYLRKYLLWLEQIDQQTVLF